MRFPNPRGVIAMSKRRWSERSGRSNSNSAISAGPFLLGCEQWKASDEPLECALHRGAAIS